MSGKDRKCNIMINLSDTQYPIIKKVAKSLNWRVSYKENGKYFDVWWTDAAVPPDKLSSLKCYQKINHFPGMYVLSRKNYLAWNLTKLSRIFPNDFDFFPQTWVLPADYPDFKSKAS